MVSGNRDTKMQNFKDIFLDIYGTPQKDRIHNVWYPIKSYQACKEAEKI